MVNGKREKYLKICFKHMFETNVYISIYSIPFKKRFEILNIDEDFNP